MAYVQKPDNNDDQNKQDSSSQSEGQSNVTSSGGNSTGTSGTGSTTHQYAPAATKSGSFHNIQNYLDANSGFNGGTGLAGKAYDTLKDQQQQQENSIQDASTQFQQGSSQSGQNYDPTKVSSFVQQATADPTKFAADPNNVSQYQTYLGGQYTGPQGLSNVGDLQNNAQQFAQTTQLTASEPGRLALLQKLYNNGNYTQGQQTLDNLLIQANPQQLQQLQSAQSLGSNLQGDINSAQNIAQNQAKQYTDWANQAQNTASTGLTNAATSIDTGLQNKANQYASDTSNDYSSLMNELSTGRITTPELQKLGLTADQVKNLYGANLGNYVSQAIAPTKVNVASRDDVSKLQALANLGGSYLPNIGTSLSQYTTDPSQVGSYDPSKNLNFDSSSFLNAVNQGKNDLQSQYTSQFYAPTTSEKVGGSTVTKLPTIAGTSVASTNNPLSDLASLQSQPYSEQNAATIQAIQKLLNKYGGSLGVDQSNTNNAPIMDPVKVPTRAKIR